MKILIVAVCLLVCVFARHSHEMDEGVQADDWKEGDNMILMNFESDCIDKINHMIHHTMESVFQYIAMATFFRRHDVDIVGMSLMYNAWARQKLNDAKAMMMYIVKRGGTIEFMDVAKPAETMWASPANAFKTTLKRERMMMMKITDLGKHAHEHGDSHLMSYIEREMVNPQTDYMFEVAAYITKLERGGLKMGLMAINKQMVTKYKDFKDTESDTDKYKWNY